MERSNQRKIRKLLAEIQLHQELLTMEVNLEDYLKSNHSANIELMHELLECMDKLEESRKKLFSEINSNDSWNDLWEKS